MRYWTAISFVLMIVGGSGLFAEDKSAPKEKTRVFRVTSEFEREQKNGSDVTIDGKTIPGRSIVRSKSTLELKDNQTFAGPHSKGEYSDGDGHKYSEDSWFEITVKSVGANRVRLQVVAKQTTVQLLGAGESRSWNLSLDASKTAKLGEKVQLELGDEKTLGTKCSFQAVIEEKDQEEK